MCLERERSAPLFPASPSSSGCLSQEGQQGALVASLTPSTIWEWLPDPQGPHFSSTYSFSCSRGFLFRRPVLSVPG